MQLSPLLEKNKRVQSRKSRLKDNMQDLDLYSSECRLVIVKWQK